MPKELEIDFQKRLEDWLNEKKIFNIRHGKDGVSDIIVCYKGRYVGLECKRPTGGSSQGHHRGRSCLHIRGKRSFPDSRFRRQSG